MTPRKHISMYYITILDHLDIIIKQECTSSKAARYQSAKAWRRRKGLQRVMPRKPGFTVRRSGCRIRLLSF